MRSGRPIASSAPHPYRGEDLVRRQLGARQADRGGRAAEVFFSADLEWMDYLEKRGLLRRGTRHDVLGNALVLIAPADSTVHLKIAPHFDSSPGLGRRAARHRGSGFGAGRLYTHAPRLTSWGCGTRGAAPGARRKRAHRARIRGAGRGRARHRVSDRRAGRETRAGGGVFPADTHPPIIYPAAVTAGRSAGSGAVPGFPAQRRVRADFRALRLHACRPDERAAGRCRRLGGGTQAHLRIARSGSPRTPAAAPRGCSSRTVRTWPPVRAAAAPRPG